MKRYRTPILLAVLLLVLGGTYFWVTASEGVEDTGVAFALKNGEAIATVELTNEYGHFLFTREEEIWLVEHNGASYRANQNKMDLMLAALERLQVSRVLEDILPEYGLEAPKAVVAVTTDQGRGYGFSLGSETASHSDVYLQDGDTGRVMVTPTGTVAQLTGSIAAYRTKDVFTIDKSHIRSLSYYQAGELVVTAENNGPQDWFLTYPFEAPARAIELNEVTAVLRGWSVAGYPDNTDYAAMGLDTPERWLDVTDANGETQRFEFGGAADGTTTYVRAGGEAEVVKLYTVDLDFSVMEPDKLLFVAPLKTTVDQVSAITIETEALSFTFDVEQVEGGQHVTCAGQEIASSDFVSVFFKYIAMNADGRDPAEVEGEPVAVLTTTFLDGSTAQLILLPRDEETYYMQIDGETEYYLTVADLEQLIYRAQKALGQIN